MGPGFESQRNHSDKSTFRKEGAFLLYTNPEPEFEDLEEAKKHNFVQQKVLLSNARR
jgi:hypothetical protein